MEASIQVGSGNGRVKRIVPILPGIPPFWLLGDGKVEDDSDPFDPFGATQHKCQDYVDRFTKLGRVPCVKCNGRGWNDRFHFDPKTDQQSLHRESCLSCGGSGYHGA